MKPYHAMFGASNAFVLGSKKRPPYLGVRITITRYFCLFPNNTEKICVIKNKRQIYLRVTQKKAKYNLQKTSAQESLFTYNYLEGGRYNYFFFPF